MLCLWSHYISECKTSAAASENEFNHANRIPCLKAGTLVYIVSRLSKCQGYLSIAYGLHKSLSLDTQDVERGQLICSQNSLGFLFAPICSRDRI